MSESEALRKRFEAEEQQAIDALARWIGPPAVHGIIGRRRIGAETVVMPIEHLLTSQIEVIRFCWHVFGIAGIEPGWELRRGTKMMPCASQSARTWTPLRSSRLKRFCTAAIGVIFCARASICVNSALKICGCSW